MSSSSHQLPRLLDQVRESIRLKHFSLSTEKSYVYYIRDFILFHDKRHPKDMGASEIRAYLSHSTIDRHVAVSTQTVVLSALLVLHRQVLDIELPYIDGIERAKRPQRLPVVFTRSEVKQILANVDGIHHLVISSQRYAKLTLQNTEVVTRYAIASPLIFLKMATIFAQYKSCLAIKM